jgi:GTP pyrophosphokinase
MSILSPRFQEALRYAVDLHAQDVRKGSGVPYVAHLLSVCGLVLSSGGSESEAIAALLHDSLEDHPAEVTKQDLESRFGSEVAAIVVACTDTGEGYQGGEKPPWRERKDRYLAHLEHATPEALRVSLADKVDNIRAIVADYRMVGEDLWSRFKAGREGQVWYFRSLLRTFESVRANNFLLAELRAGVRALEELLHPRP